ncbi:MAG: sugar phosphate isomerase/epimerase family protein [Planctomycetia bacterium]|nr:sugar phosphate isomerase/epimerase family protein [Planctomycetia bacterium]
MKYAVNTLLWSDTLDERMLPVMEQLKEIGYDAIEFPLFAPDLEKCHMLGEVAGKLGLSVTTCTCRDPDDNPASSDPDVRRRGIENNKRMIDCSAALGSSLLIGPYHAASGVFTGKPVQPDEWKKTAAAMREVAQYAASRGIRMALECVNRFETYFCTTIEEGLRFLDEIDCPNYGIMFDTFHANIEEKSLAAAIRLAANSGKLYHVHISENDRSTPGAGNVNWSEVFATLQEVKYDGTLCIEAFGSALPKLAAVTKIWRKMFADETQLVTDGLRFMRESMK